MLDCRIYPAKDTAYSQSPTAHRTPPLWVYVEFYTHEIVVGHSGRERETCKYVVEMGEALLKWMVPLVSRGSEAVTWYRAR